MMLGPCEHVDANQLFPSWVTLGLGSLFKVQVT